MEEVILTEEEEELTKYCEDFCPISNVITEYNEFHRAIICCPTEMRKRVTEAYVLNRRNKEQ